MGKGSGIVLGIVFFPFRDFCFDLLFCPFSVQFAAFWSWKLPFQRYCNILEFEPLICHGICSILVLKLFMLDGILRLGSIQGLFRFVLVFISNWFRVGFVFLRVSFRVGLGLIWGWFRIYVGLVERLLQAWCEIYVGPIQGWFWFQLQLLQGLSRLGFRSSSGGCMINLVLVQGLFRAQ